MYFLSFHTYSRARNYKYQRGKYVPTNSIGSMIELCQDIDHHTTCQQDDHMSVFELKTSVADNSNLLTFTQLSF